MKTRLMCENPGEIVYTLKVTMTADQWDKLRAQLDTAKQTWCYPIGDLRNQIDDLLTQARQVYYPKPDEPA